MLVAQILSQKCVREVVRAKDEEEEKEKKEEKRTSTVKRSDITAAKHHPNCPISRNHNFAVSQYSNVALSQFYNCITTKQDLEVFPPC